MIIIPSVKDGKGKDLELVNIKNVRLKNGGKKLIEVSPLYSSDGKNWFIEKNLISDHIKVI